MDRRSFDQGIAGTTAPSTRMAPNQPPTTFCNQHHPMHTEQSIHLRKRPRPPEDFTGTSPKQACKKQKIQHPSGSLLPPAFWDNLSEVWLTHNALRELDRRNNEQATANVSPKRQFLRPVTRNESKTIQRFARQGGPDLSELRGYPEPTMKPKRTVSASRGSSDSRGLSTLRSIKPSTTKSSGPYNRNFQQHLTNHGFFPHRYRFPDGRSPSKPGNWDNILARLAHRRPSLSPSKFAEEDFEKFLQADADASKERQVRETVIIPFIEGGVPDNKRTNGGIPFRNLDHLTDGTLVPGNPDRYDGARLEQLDVQIQVELNNQIVPSTQHDLPIAPNFFLTVKGPDGLASVAKRQACYDGALGARGLHSLQEYGKDKPEFNNNASTLTSIYHNGQLQMFTSHPSKSATSDRTEYYMTQLRSFSITGNLDTFREGVTWYRNGRDWAKEQRDEAIRRANEKATQNIVESTAVNEISSTESVASITEQTYFSFNGTNTTETHSAQSTRSFSPKPA